MKIKALFKCSDGQCYPCLVLGTYPDLYNLLPSVMIMFIKSKPADCNRYMEVNMLSIRYESNHGTSS